MLKRQCHKKSNYVKEKYTYLKKISVKSKLPHLWNGKKKLLKIEISVKSRRTSSVMKWKEEIAKKKNKC